MPENESMYKWRFKILALTAISLTLMRCAHPYVMNSPRAPASLGTVESNIRFTTGFSPKGDLDFYAVTPDGKSSVPTKYELTDQKDLSALNDQLEALLDLGKAQQSAKSSSNDQSGAQPRKLPVIFSSKGVRLGLKLMRQEVAVAMSSASTPEQIFVAKASLLEIGRLYPK